MRNADNLPPSCAVVMKSGNLNFLEPSGPVLACNGTALPLLLLLLYMAKFKHEVIRCAEDKGNGRASAIFGVDESNVKLWRKHKAAISGCEAS